MTRIEELKQKFDENPRRYFAPLANELRKQGDLDQAISICRSHLPGQPGHVSGHIVLAQALHEAGEVDQSRTEFEAALELDPENLIALRHMGDIARGCGEFENAHRWYRRVLDADPRNYEIAQILRDLESSPNEVSDTASTADEASLAATPVSSPSVAAVLDDTTTPVEQPESSWHAMSENSGAPIALAPVPDEPAPDIGNNGDDHTAPASPVLDAFDTELPDTSPSPTAAVDQEIVAETLELDTNWDVPPSPASALSDYEAAPEDWFDEPAPAQAVHRDEVDLAFGDASGAPAGVDDIESLFGAEPPPASTDPTQSESRDAHDLPALIADGLGLGDMDNSVESAPSPGEATPEVTSISPEPLTVSNVEASEPTVEAPPPSEQRAPAEELEALAGRTPTFTKAVSEPATPPPFVTETLAELYLQQGFRQEAIEIYQQLLARDPADEELRDRVSAIVAGSTTLAIDARPTAAAPLGNEKAAQSVRTFFGRLARRQPGRGSGFAGSGPKNRTGEYSVHSGEEAPVAKSLNELFAGPATTVEDAAAATLASAFSNGTPGGRPSHTAERELSLDHLFKEAAPAPEAHVGLDEFYSPTGSDKPPNEAPPPRTDEQAADIRHFTSWLEGLKKK